MDESWDSLVDSMLCDSNSMLIPSGFYRSHCTDEILMFVNAGGEALAGPDSTFKIMGDVNFEGGDILRTNEHINEAGDFPFIYQSARLGHFAYQFNNLPPGSYFEEKVLSEFDIFSLVGVNKPLQLVDSRVTVKDGGVIVERFEEIIGSPIFCGICTRKAPELSVPPLEKIILNAMTVLLKLKFLQIRLDVIHRKRISISDS